MKISRDNIIEELLKLFPLLKNEIDIDSGVYEVLGEFACFLGEGIENQTIENPELKNAIDFINVLSSNRDVEIKNMLVAGIFETLCNYESSMEYIKKRINSEGIQLYDQYCS